MHNGYFDQSYVEMQSHLISLYLPDIWYLWSTVRADLQRSSQSLRKRRITRIRMLVFSLGRMIFASAGVPRMHVFLVGSAKTPVAER